MKDDVISRQAAADVVDFECGEWRGLAKTIIDKLEALPSVDAVPVVRCGECRYWDRSPSCSATPQYHACKRRIFADVHTMRDDFCSQGERKDGDHHEG